MSSSSAEWVPLVKEEDIEEKLKAVESRVTLAARDDFSFTDYEELKDLLIELQMDLVLTSKVELLRRAALKLAELLKRLALACVPYNDK